MTTITIRQQCWDRAADEVGSDLSANRAAEMLRARGHTVELADGDWGSSYTVDDGDAVAHAEVQNLQSGLL